METDGGTDQPLEAVLGAAKRLSACPDGDDNRFLECAAAAEADYLVTGNKRHFPMQWKKTRIVNARELLHLLAANDPQTDVEGF